MNHAALRYINKVRVLRGAVAISVLLAFGACYASPSAIIPITRAAKCCPGHGSCCRKGAGHHTGANGSLWTSLPACGQNCPLPASLSGHASSAVVLCGTNTGFAASIDTLGPREVKRAGRCAYFAFLYQRPPPFTLF